MQKTMNMNASSLTAKWLNQFVIVIKCILNYTTTEFLVLVHRVAFNLSIYFFLLGLLTHYLAQ